MKLKNIIAIILILPFSVVAQNQSSKQKNDSNSPLHLMKSNYKIPYGIPDTTTIELQLKHIFELLNKETPMQLTDLKSGKIISDFSAIDGNSALVKGAFRLNSYEWGVTYIGMLNSGKITGNNDFSNYTINRIAYLSKLVPYFKKVLAKTQTSETQINHMINPEALDDAGSICVAFIRSTIAKPNKDTDAIIRNYIDYIMNKQFRLADGTLARNRPQLNTLWLDDMFMGVPALAWMGKYTGEQRYFDEAVKQIHQFSKRMFVPEKGLFMHGWVEGMEQHPAFFWGRANGWAIMTLVEVLKVLPTSHPGYAEVMQLMKSHLSGLARLQSSDGFWYQLLDRPDSYLETSATAIYAYCMATAINQGWVDPLVFGPPALLAWNAVSTQITPEGLVKGTCVGTGMGFDPAYYYYRPVNEYAAHGYGPVLLAGSEIIELLRICHPKMNDSAVQFYSRKIDTNSPIFEVK